MRQRLATVKNPKLQILHVYSIYLAQNVKKFVFESGSSLINSALGTRVVMLEDRVCFKSVEIWDCHWLVNTQNKSQQHTKLFG